MAQEWKVNMNSEKYRILIGNYVIAENMELETALLLIESMFEKYYNESMGYIIEKMPKARMDCEEE